MILLVFFFRLNPEMVRTLRWAEFDIVGDEVVVAKLKHRARIRQLPGYPVGDEPLNPVQLRTFLRRWTKPLNDFAAPRPNAVIMVWSHGGGVKACEIDVASFTTYLVRRFTKASGLAWFTLGMLRPTAVDAVDRFAKGDPELRAAVGRHGMRVNRRHYDALWTVVEDQKRVALLQMVRGRDLRSKAAARATGRIGGDNLAATPGFRCSNPFYRGYTSSPPGTFCDAVGMCAVCRHGSTDLDSVHDYACARAVGEALEDELAGAPDAGRIGVLSPVLDEISLRLLPSFSPEVRATPIDQLPQVPSLKGALSWPPVR